MDIQKDINKEVLKSDEEKVEDLAKDAEDLEKAVEKDIEDKVEKAEEVNDAKAEPLDAKDGSGKAVKDVVASDKEFKEEQECEDVEFPEVKKSEFVTEKLKPFTEKLELNEAEDYESSDDLDEGIFGPKITSCLVYKGVGGLHCDYITDKGSRDDLKLKLKQVQDAGNYTNIQTMTYDSAKQLFKKSGKNIKQYLGKQLDGIADKAKAAQAKQDARDNADRAAAAKEGELQRKYAAQQKADREASRRAEKQSVDRYTSGLVARDKARNPGYQSSGFHWSESLGEDLEESLKEGKEDIKDDSYYVLRTGGSIGDKEAYFGPFDSVEEAKAYAADRRKMLSPGERKYYRMGYTTMLGSKLKNRIKESYSKDESLKENKLNESEEDNETNIHDLKDFSWKELEGLKGKTIRALKNIEYGEVLDFDEEDMPNFKKAGLRVKRSGDIIIPKGWQGEIVYTYSYEGANPELGIEVNDEYIPLAIAGGKAGEFSIIDNIDSLKEGKEDIKDDSYYVLRTGGSFEDYSGPFDSFEEAKTYAVDQRKMLPQDGNKYYRKGYKGRPYTVIPGSKLKKEINDSYLKDESLKETLENGTIDTRETEILDKAISTVRYNYLGGDDKAFANIAINDWGMTPKELDIFCGVDTNNTNESLKENKLNESDEEDLRKDANSLSDYLSKNKLYCDLEDYEMYPLGVKVFTFRVEGDWKHDHWYFNTLVGKWAKENGKEI